MKTKIAIIGLGHVHAKLLYQAFNLEPERVEWLGIADMTGLTDEETRLNISLNAGEAANLPFFKDYHELLALKPDLVLCGSGIHDHVPIAIDSLKANASVILEKPMAICFEDAAAMYKAHLESKGELMVNWPVAWFPAFRKAKEWMKEGRIGRVVRFQYRTPATLGPYSKNDDVDVNVKKKLWWYQHDMGGGSIMDYAGYSATLATWYLEGKQAQTVYGIKKNVFIPFSDAEDYSFFMVNYDDAIALMEGSWSTVSSGEIPTGPILYGTEGTIVCDRFSNKVKLYTTYRPYKECLPPEEVYEAPLGNYNAGLSDNVLNHMQNGAPLFDMITADFNIRAAAVLDAGRTSCETGKPETVKIFQK